MNNVNVFSILVVWKIHARARRRKWETRRLLCSPTQQLCVVSPPGFTLTTTYYFASFQKCHQAKDHTTPASTPSPLRIHYHVVYSHIGS